MFGQLVGGAALAAASAWSPTPASADTVGKPAVVDGDTLDFSGRRVRLYGVDAPEMEQTCRADGRTWPCGREARWAALNHLSPHWVTCVAKGQDADGTQLAVCHLAGAGQLDLAAWLVAQGWALADPAAPPLYADQERAARAARRGLWRGDFVPPWEWRAGRRLAP